MKMKSTLWTSAVLLASCWLAALPADAVVLTNADGVIRNSLCVGFDCPNSPAFSDTTVLLVENNTRIKFDDTSVLAGFPNNDWELQANSGSSGGGNFFAINDCGTSSGGGCADDPVLKIEAGAPANSIFVDDSGRVGFGTGVPALELHVVDGDSPALRLEQDASSGFTPQTWDLAGNETNFFVRDVTMGSGLPLRIRPGAGSNALFIDSDGDIGMGTSSPGGRLHIDDNDNPGFRTRQGDTGGGRIWDFRQEGNGNFSITEDGTGGAELRIYDSDAGVNAGNVEIRNDLLVLGDAIITGQCTEADGACAPDYVFEPDYPLLSLDELGAFIAKNKHLPNVPSADEFAARGINMRRFNFAVLEKIEELVLYTLAQQETIESLQARLEALEEQPEK